MKWVCHRSYEPPGGAAILQETAIACSCYCATRNPNLIWRRHFNAVKHENEALAQLVQSDQPLTSPAEKYIKFLRQYYERTHSENRILHCENEGLKAATGRRGRNLSGRRHAIVGEHLVTTPEILGASQMLRK